MIDIDLLIVQVPGVERRDVERWIVEDWVRPEEEGGRYAFREIDVARIRLIRELLEDMKLNEEALPVVLALLDQLYESRRRIHDVGRALALLAPEELRLRLMTHLADLGEHRRSEGY